MSKTTEILLLGGAGLALLYMFMSRPAVAPVAPVYGGSITANGPQPVSPANAGNSTASAIGNAVSSVSDTVSNIISDFS